MTERYQYLFEKYEKNLIADEKNLLLVYNTLEATNIQLGEIKECINEKDANEINSIIEFLEFLGLLIDKFMKKQIDEIVRVSDLVNAYCTQNLQLRSLLQMRIDDIDITDAHNSSCEVVMLKSELQLCRHDIVILQDTVKIRDDEIIKLRGDVQEFYDANNEYVKQHNEFKQIIDELQIENTEYREKERVHSANSGCIMSRHKSQCILCVNYKSTDDQSIYDFCDKECQSCIGFSRALQTNSKIQGAEMFFATKSKVLLDTEIQDIKEVYAIKEPINPKYVNTKDKYLTVTLVCSLYDDGPNEENLRKQLIKNFNTMAAKCYGPVALVYSIHIEYPAMRLYGMIRYDKTKCTKLSTSSSIFNNMIKHTIVDKFTQRPYRAIIISEKWDKTYQGYHTLLNLIIETYTTISKSGPLIGDSIEKFIN